MRWAPALGYLLAQIVSLAVWGLGVLVGGVGEARPDEAGTAISTSFEGELRSSLEFVALLVLPPAVLFGLLHGALRCARSPVARAVAAAGLVLLTLFWTAPAGTAGAYYGPDLFGYLGRPPLLPQWLGGLVAIELALVVEWVAASATVLLVVVFGLLVGFVRLLVGFFRRLLFGRTGGRF